MDFQLLWIPHLFTSSENSKRRNCRGNPTWAGTLTWIEFWCSSTVEATLGHIGQCLPPTPPTLECVSSLREARVGIKEYSCLGALNLSLPLKTRHFKSKRCIALGSDSLLRSLMNHSVLFWLLDMMYAFFGPQQRPCFLVDLPSTSTP